MKEHKMLVAPSPSSPRYSVVTCTGCGYTDEFAYITKKGVLQAADKREFNDHVRATQVANYEVDFEPGALIAEVKLKRGSRTFWAYHVNDPQLPTARGWHSTLEVDDRRKDILASGPKGSYVYYYFANPWVGVERNTTSTKVITWAATRESVISQLLKQASLQANRGDYQFITHQDLSDTGITAPVTSWQDYVTQLVEKYRNAQSVSKIREGLEEIQDLNMMLAAVDELERELKSRLYGSLTDL